MHGATIKTDVCTATQHFPQFSCTYCPTEFFPVQMIEFPHSTVPKFRCSYFHTTFFHNSEICVATRHVSRYSNFLLQYSSLPNSDVCIATQYVFHIAPVVKRGQSTTYQLYMEIKKVICFTKTNALTVKIFHTQRLFLKMKLSFFTCQRGPIGE